MDLKLPSLLLASQTCHASVPHSTIDFFFSDERMSRQEQDTAVLAFSNLFSPYFPSAHKIVRRITANQHNQNAYETEENDGQTKRQNIHEIKTSRNPGSTDKGHYYNC